MFKNWPTKSQWKYFFKILSKKEKIAFLGFFVLTLVSSVFLLTNFYFKNTEIAPAKGGTYIEGLVGQPRFINPVYANSDVDRDLIQLTFSGLMKYDKNLQIVPDLAKDYIVEEDGKVYTFYLKKNLLWQDKTPLTTDDIIFTIKTIQNPDFNSPYRANWVGVEVEKIDDLTIRFKLKKAYSAFLENATSKILPQHIWQNILPENFPLEPYNLESVGSGPYKVKKIERKKDGQLTSLTLNRNPYYFGKQPYISEIKFLFFNNEEELIKEAQRKKIKGLGLNSLIELNEDWQNYLFSFPRYFAVFFNQEKSKALSYKEVRLALNYGTNKEEFGQKVVLSPVLPEIYGIDLPSKIYEFDIEKAKQILEEAGFKDDDKNGIREKIIKKKPAFEFQSRLSLGSKGKEVTELQKCLEVEITGYFGSKTKAAAIKFQEKYNIETTGTVGKNTREKLNEICFGEPEEVLFLSFSLVTVDQLQMVKMAELLKEQWKVLGVEIKIEKYPLSQLEQDFIKTRNYEMLLFGEVLGAIPDPFPFWHSSQKKDPGLNLSLYDNKKADDLLEEVRKSSTPKDRTEKLALFQNILIEDAPAVFLYNPGYLYFISKEIKGVDPVRDSKAKEKAQREQISNGVEGGKIIDPSKRFINIEDWYVKTKRAWK